MFKDQLARDLAGTFHNIDEFAELKMVYYDGNEHEVNMILDFDMAEKRDKPAKDNAYGVYAQKAKVYILASDIKFRQGSKIEVDDDRYTILAVASEMGEIILDLERLDE